MIIRAGYRIAFECAAPTPMLLQLNVHPSREADLLSPDIVSTNPVIPNGDLYRFVRQSGDPGRTRTRTGHLQQRFSHPRFRVAGTDACGRASDAGDETAGGCPALSPAEPLLRQRQSQRFRLVAIRLRRLAPAPGSSRLFAISSTVTFISTTSAPIRAGPPPTGFARASACAADFAHLAIALCRCMNVPARYCAGYLGDIGVPRESGPDGLLRLVRGLYKWPVVCVRRPAQPSADRQDRHGLRT